MKAKTTGIYALTALGAVLVVVVCLSRSASVEAIYPLERGWRLFKDVVCARISGAWRGAAAGAENARLRREIGSLAIVREDLARLEMENARLRRALDYTAKAPETWLAAAVLADGGANASGHRSLRTDKGSLAGVKVGAVVTVPEGLVGRVVSVTPHTSEVAVLADARMKVSCEVVVPSGEIVRGMLAGGTDERLVLKHILSSAEVPPRSQVFTSGLGGVYPKGISVGTLIEVLQDHDSPRREGVVLPAVDFSTLRDVFIRREK